MQTCFKAIKTGKGFFASLTAGATLALAALVSASSSHQVEQLDSLAVPRTGHAAIALSDGRVLITGGRDSAGNRISLSEIFDPETQSSAASATLTTARVGHTATRLADGRVLVAGGNGDSGPLSSAEIFDPANPDAGFRVLTSTMSAARARHTATLLNNGTVLIAGGEATGTAEIFDPSTELFSPTLWAMTQPRTGHTATLFTDDSVLLAGGGTDSIELFTPSDQKFTLEAAMMSAARTGHWALELSDTRLILFEGDTGNTIDEYNPTTGTITPKGSLGTQSTSTTLLVNGKVLVLGSDQAGLYDANAVPPSPSFTAFDETSVPGSSVLLRGGQSATELSGDKKILVAGGVDAANLLAGIALFNPAKIWTDKDDYYPDEPVILSGSGWKANENIYLYAVDNETEQWTYEMTVPADANGEFVLNPYFVVELRHLGVQFHVTALGAQSAMQADVYFTDNITAVLYEDAARTIRRDAFAWGATVYLGATLTGQSPNKCYRADWVNPSNVVVQTTQFEPNTLQDSFLVPSSAPNGIWQVKLYEATANGPCSGATFPANPTMTLNFDVARAVIIGALADNYVDLKNPTTIQNAAGTTLIVGKKNASNDEQRAFLRFDLSGISGTINSAKLRTSISAEGNSVLGPPPRTHDVHRVTATWTDTSINWNNQPGVAGSPTNSQPVTAALTLMRWTVTTDVAAFVASPSSNFGWRVSDPGANQSNSDVTYNSTQANTSTDKTKAPVLLVDYTNATPTPTPTATPTPTPTPTPTATPTPTPTPTPATTTLTVTAAAGTYGGTVNFSATLTSGASGISGQSISFTRNGTPVGSATTNGSGVATLSGVSLCGVNANTYASGVGASFAGDTSYAANSGSAQLTVGKANAMVTVTPYTVMYDGGSHTATVASITGVCGETDATVGTAHLGGTTHVMAGTYSSDTWSFTGTANYNDIADTPITDVIDKKDATWTTNPNSKTYGDADPNPLTTGSGSGFVDTVTATYSRDPGETVLGGPYHITATLGPADVVANYNIINAGAAFTINTRSATWTTNPSSKTYGDADPNPLTTGSGNFLAADNVTATYSRDPGETVLGGPYHITAALAPSGVLSNYSITNAGASFTINTRPATWTTNPNSKTYGDADPNPLTTGSGDFLAADNVTATYSRAAGETVMGGPYHITATLSPAAVLSNYSITNAGASFTINTRPATWTTNPNSKTYGDADPNPLTTGSGDFLAADNVTATYSRAAGETVMGGPYHITATLSPAAVLSNYSITNAGAAFTINTRPATWTTNPNSKTYGDADPNPLTTGSGDFLAADNVTATYSRAAGETVMGGPYHITATLSPAAVLSNYSITNAGAAFTINTRPATWTTNPNSKTYGDADPNPLTTGSGDFLVADGVTATYSRAAGETVLGGPYQIAATLSPAAVLSNYSITNAGASFTINTRLATWTTNPSSKTYGNADPVPLTTGSGDFLAADNVTATYSRDPGETVLGGPYHIAATLSPAAVLSNYSITNAGASFTINTRLATWTTNPSSKTYGNADPVPLTTGSGDFLAADNVTATYSRDPGETVLGGPYQIAATLSPAAVLSNYSITNAGASFTINTRLATWTTNPSSKTYGNADPVPLTTGSGDFLAADNVTATYSRDPGETVLGGPYQITATLSPAAVLSNYSITNAGASFTINTRPATWTTNPNSKTYGNADPNPLTTGSGDFLAADNVTATYSRDPGETVLGGPYQITATLSPAAVLSNYSIANAGASFTINTRPATVTADNKMKTYGDANPTLTATVTNVVTGDTLNYSLATSATQCSSVGPYTITVTLGSNPNYNVTPTNGTLTINKKHLTVAADNKSKVYNGSPFTAFTVMITGFTCGDGVAVVSGSATYTGSAVGATLPGTYTITPQVGTLTATNYDFTPFVNGTLTIGYGTCTGSDPGGVILPPINSDGTSVYKRKAGSTIPVKFKVCDANGNSISDPNVVFQTGCCGSITWTNTSRGTVDNVNEVNGTDIPDVAFRWTGDHWQFNMDTMNLQAGSTYTFHIPLRYGEITFVLGMK